LSRGIWRRARVALSHAVSTVRHLGSTDLKAVNVAFVDRLKAEQPHDAAMEKAVGGRFEHYGAIELSLLRRYGLRPNDYLIDVGCGAGRLARPLAGYLTGRYLGIDLVPALVRHARRIAGRADWRFEVVDHIGIPEAEGQADMVCFFSVLTHLTHEQSYWYLEEAARVLKPGGRIVFSFLEFGAPEHLFIFWETLKAAKRRSRAPMNTFIERSVIAVFARELGLEVVEFRAGTEAVVDEGALGQSLCVLARP
jgi:SAM-dependent methyltransferase